MSASSFGSKVRSLNDRRTLKDDATAGLVLGVEADLAALEPYRQAMVGVLTKRTLAAAYEQAQGVCPAHPTN